MNKITAYTLIIIGILIAVAACISYYTLWSITSRSGASMGQLGIMIGGKPLTDTGFLVIHAILLILGGSLAFLGWKKRKTYA